MKEKLGGGKETWLALLHFSDPSSCGPDARPWLEGRMRVPDHFIT
jgi:hypothetical protein